MKKRWKLISLLLVCASLAGCGQNNQNAVSTESASQATNEVSSSGEAEDNEESAYFDEKAIKAIAEGLERRWNLIEQEQGGSASQSYTIEISAIEPAYSAYINAELGVLNKYDFEKESFKDTELQNKVIKYVDGLNKGKESLKLATADFLDFELEYNSIYVDRIDLLNDFHTNYGMETEDKFKHYFDEMSIQREDTVNKLEKYKKLKEIVNKIEFEIDDTKYDGYYYNYEAYIDNDSDFTISSLVLKVTLLDDNGVNINTYYPSIDELASHEKGKLTDFSDEGCYKNWRIQVNSFSLN